MGVKGTCRSGNRGGCPSFMLNPPHIWANIQHPPAYPLPIIRAKYPQTGQKWIIFWCALVFSREIGRPKGVKSKHIFEIWCRMWVRWLPAFACPWCRWSGLLSDALPSWCVPRPLSSLLLCLWCITLEYGSISRFKGVLARFGVWMYVCIGLGFCVDCGAFVCVSG